ncbi:uncharacterized protein LOC120270179 [Dioscorea cayenensis subsp. rotundata]|uniref:Uncharacterized protein LOC120270179 n=1 Tax=Dioscorea cayennensis subsp. rotundata TaxID=55577 RepID=A0AB40C296_DIOCR|nr:uncharacterized protein LOC120270179 [Dioscorea cayenensis subsp. rotundata]
MDNANYLESHSNQVMPPMLLEKDHDHHQATSSKFLTPLKVRSKGRPPSKRKKSKVEEMIIRNKKKKTQATGNVQMQNDTQIEIHTQESVVTSNFFPNVMNVDVYGFNWQNAGNYSSSQGQPSNYSTPIDSAEMLANEIRSSTSTGHESNSISWANIHFNSGK